LTKPTLRGERRRVASAASSTRTWSAYGGPPGGQSSASALRRSASTAGGGGFGASRRRTTSAAPSQRRAWNASACVPGRAGVGQRSSASFSERPPRTAATTSAAWPSSRASGNAAFGSRADTRRV
jgi:hypothetical protein